MINQTLLEFKTRFDSSLEKYFEEKIKEAKETGEISEGMLKILKEFTLRGGKRIRPALVYHTFLCFSDKNLDEAIKAGIAVELIQSFLLIHDDIMDNDNLRRGKPTVHKIYSNCFKEEHLGTSLAIICGDLAFSLANEILMSLNLPDKIKVKAGKLLNEMLNNVSFGQELDIVFSREKEITKEKLFKMHKLKTAKYTFELPILLGAIMGDAQIKDFKILKEYSTPMGMAFQLQDDLLGLFGSEKKLGKPVGSDIREGKKTLLILKAKENCSASEKKFLNKVIGNKDITLKDIKEVQRIVQDSGALEYNKKLAEQLILKAKNALKNLDVNKEGKTFFLELSDYLLERDY